MQAIRLFSETDFAEKKGHWLTTYNIVCAVLFVLAFLYANTRGMGIGGSCFAGVLVVVGAFLIKQEAAKLKQCRIASCTFALDCDQSAEEIGQRVAYPLMERGIETILEDGSLMFKGKTANYTFVCSQGATWFSLDWSYPVGKIFSPMRLRYIADYRELLAETGTIAYFIQHEGGIR